MVVRRRVGREGQVVLLGRRRAGRRAPTPGCDPRELARRGRSRGRWFRYFEQSITTATLQHWPARLVPPPRERIGAPCARQTATVAIDVVDVARDDDADRHLAVVRAVGRVERAAAGVEAHLAADGRGQRAAQRGGRRRRRGGALPGARRGRPWRRVFASACRRSREAETVSLMGHVVPGVQLSDSSSARRLDVGEVGQRLREVAEHPPLRVSYSSAKRPRSLAVAVAASKTSRASSEPALAGEALGQPERAGQERALAARHARRRRRSGAAGRRRRARSRIASAVRTIRSSSQSTKPIAGQAQQRRVESVVPPNAWTKRRACGRSLALDRARDRRARLAPARHRRLAHALLGEPRGRGRAPPSTAPWSARSGAARRATPRSRGRARASARRRRRRASTRKRQ